MSNDVKYFLNFWKEKKKIVQQWKQWLIKTFTIDFTSTFSAIKQRLALIYKFNNLEREKQRDIRECDFIVTFWTSWIFFNPCMLMIYKIKHKTWETNFKFFSDKQKMKKATRRWKNQWDHGCVGWERVTRKWFSFLCWRGEMKCKKQAGGLKFEIWN